MRLSIYRIRSGNKQQQLVGLCETTIQNIIDNCANDEASSERDFFLQRNYRQLQQVGSLRVKVASLVTLSGRLLSQPLTTASQTSPPVSPLIAPSSPYSIERTTSMDSTITASEDPFNVDLRQLSMRFSASQIAPTTTLNDFIDNGGQLDFCVAIDFTSSNGTKRKEKVVNYIGHRK